MSQLIFPYKRSNLKLTKPSTKNQQTITMNKFLDILETSEAQQEETFNEEKVRFINSKTGIWSYCGISKSAYLSYSHEEKTNTFRDYCKNLVEKYYSNNGKIELLISLLKMVCFLMLMMFLLYFLLITFFSVIFL